jgi:hypothetical protein
VLMPLLAEPALGAVVANEDVLSGLVRRWSEAYRAP